MATIVPASAIAGLTSLAKMAINTADELSQLSKRTGIMVEDLSKLSYAAKLADTNMAEFSIGIRTMASATTMAVAGSKEMQRAFQTVGLSMQELKTLDPKSLFLSVATGLERIEDPALKVATAQVLLGRSAQNLLPLMKDLAGNGFAEVSKEAERLGQVISGETARSAEEFNDNLDRLKAAAMGVANHMAREFLPTLTAVSQNFVELSKSTATAESGLLRFLNPITLISVALKGMVALAQAAGTLLGGIFAAFERAATTNLTKLRDLPALLRQMKGDIASSWQLATERWDALFNRPSAVAPAPALPPPPPRGGPQSPGTSGRERESELPRGRFSIDPSRLTPWNLGLSIVDPAIHERTLDFARQRAQTGDAIAAAVVERLRAQPHINAISSIFADAALTGGKNFGQIAGGVFNQMVVTGLDQQFAKFFGNPIEKDGKWFAGDGVTPLTLEQAERMKKRAGYAQGAMAVVGAGLTGYRAGQQGEGGRTAGAISGLMAGMSTGNWVVALVGAIAGFIGGAVGEKDRQADYKFAHPYITKDGTAHLGYPKNLSPGEIDRTLTEMTSTLQTFWNGYVKVLLELPNSVIPELQAIDGKFQDRPSSKYMKHLEEWLTRTLPDEIAKQFESGMRDAFTGAGMDRFQFDRYLAEAKGLDPKLALQFWSDMSQGMAAFARAQQNMAAVRSSLFDDPMGGHMGLLAGRYRFAANGRLMEGNESQFQADIRVAGEGLFRIAREMVNLTGPERVAAFKALGQGVEAVTKSLQAYIQQIGETIKNLRTTFGDEKTAKAVERAATPQEKGAILWAQYNMNLAAIENASKLGLTASEVDAYTRRNIQLLNEIYALDPSAEMYEWWKRQMATLEEVSTRSLEALAKQAHDQVTQLLTSLEPFRQWFLGLPVSLDPAWKALDTQILGAAAALQELTRRLTLPPPPTQVPVPPGGGSPGTPGNPGGGGRPANANATAAPVEITLNVNVTGGAVSAEEIGASVRQAVEEAGLVEQVRVAVQQSMRNNPTSYEPAF